MKIAVLPNLTLFRHSIILDSRRVMPYLGRFLCGLIVFVFLLEFQGSYSWRTAVGLRFFQLVAHINLVILTLSGIAFYASGITEEKEEQILPLMQMTGMSTLNIVLSKFIGRLLSGVMLLSTQVPFAILAVTLGGISLDQIIAVYIVLGAYLFMICGMGLLASTVCATSRRASGLAFLFLLLFHAMPLIAAIGVQLIDAFGLLPFFFGTHSDNTAIRMCMDLVLPFSPFYAVAEEILITGFTGTMMCFQVWTNLAIGAVMLGLSLWGFRYFSDRPQWSFGRTGLSRKNSRLWWLAPPRTWRFPLIWKEFFFCTGGLTGLTIRAIIYSGLLIFAFVVVDRSYSYWENISIFILVTAAWLLPLELTATISRVFSEEVRQGTLATLMITPKHLLSVVFQKVIGVLLALAPLIAYGLAGVLAYPRNLTRMFDYGDDWIVVVLYFVGVACYLVFVAYYSLLVRYGSFALAGATVFLSFFLLMILVRDPQAGCGISIFLGIHLIPIMSALTVVRLKQLTAA